MRGVEYTAEALECRACAARDRKAHAWRESPNAEPFGIQFIVRPETSDHDEHEQVDGM